MASIREIVQEAITTGYLSLAAVKQLHQMLEKEYEDEDLDALMSLHQAAADGKVRQELNEAKSLPSVKKKPGKRGIVKMKLVCETAFASAIVATIVFALPKNSDISLIAPQSNSAQIINFGDF
jgi:hypothetical protein